MNFLRELLDLVNSGLIQVKYIKDLKKYSPDDYWCVVVVSRSELR